MPKSKARKIRPVVTRTIKRHKATVTYQGADPTPYQPVMARDKKGNDLIYHDTRGWKKVRKDVSKGKQMIEKFMQRIFLEEPNYV